MLKKQLEKQLANALNTGESQIQLYPEEKEYVNRHQLLSKNIAVIENDATLRFSGAVIERCDKATEDLLSHETSNFLSHPVAYLKENRNEFVHMESTSLTNIGVDAIALEFDEVFETYTAMLGLQLQKKYGISLKDHINGHLIGDGITFSVLFSEEDGLWHVNLPINFMEGFDEEFTLDDAYQLIYSFLFSLVEAVEESH